VTSISYVIVWLAAHCEHLLDFSDLEISRSTSALCCRNPGTLLSNEHSLVRASYVHLPTLTSVAHKAIILK
jgi:hypothetical protein